MAGDSQIAFSNTATTPQTNQYINKYILGRNIRI